MQIVRAIAAFIILATFLVPKVSSKPQKKILCRFASKEYSPGDVWYPANERYCIRCSCLTTGKLNCTSQECPADCGNMGSRVTEQHPCCKTCSIGNPGGGLQGRALSGTAVAVSDSIAGDNAAINRNNNGGSGLLTSSQTHQNPSGEEEDEEESFVTENSEFVSCLHQGKIYRDGEAFTANVSGLPISVVDQCMQCVCQSGMVLCQLESCSTVKCGSSSSGTSDTCCQRCSVWRGSRRVKADDDEEADPQTFSTSTDHKDSTDVGSNGENSANGFSSGFGSHQESSVTFRDVSALDGQDGKGRNGRRQATEDCISGGRFYIHGSKWHPIIGPFGIMECVVCTCTSGEIDCNRLKCPPKKDLPCPKPAKVEGHCCPICTGTTAIAEGSKMCVSGKQDVTAYRSHGFGLNGTEVFQFAFVKYGRNVVDSQIDHHEWILKSGEVLQFTTKYISPEDFTDLRNRQTFVLLGATHEKNVEKFTRREKKLEKRCTTRCGIRILGLERSLRIHRLTSRKQCLPHERTVST